MFSNRTLVLALVLGAGCALGACGASEPVVETPPVPAGPPRGILEAADLDRAVATTDGPLLDQDETSCLAANLDAELDEKQLRLLAEGKITPDESTPPFGADIERISESGAGCVSDEDLRAAMVEAWLLGYPGSSRAKAECYMDQFFTPGVGKVLAWKLRGPTSIEVKEASVHTHC